MVGEQECSQAQNAFHTENLQMKRLVSVGLLLVSSAITLHAQKQVVTAAQANGVYRSGKSEFRILARGRNKLKVQFDGVYMTVSGTPNMGYALGEAIIDGNIATFIPSDTTGCNITLIFLNKKLKVMQDGSDSDCGFGHNVFATGTYRKIKSGKPTFISPP